LQKAAYGRPFRFKAGHRAKKGGIAVVFSVDESPDRE
jgi:hypothetical protein